MRRLFALVTLVLFTPAASAADPNQVEFFEKKVRPVLAEHCYGCHGPKKQNAGLRLDTAAGLKQGADAGPVVKPGDPDTSRLIASVKRVGDYPMPPKATLPPEAVANLTEWVKAGAVFPNDLVRTAPAADPRQHWAFRPVREPAMSEVRAHAGAVRNEIDRFVLAKLEEKGIVPAPPADRRTLIRRAHIDLTGLPPTPEEVEAFENDESPDAWEKLVDRLLASPHYGERWARYWLDLARYSDTKGYVFQEDRAFPFAYTYRDYVIRSLNEDKPYDRFVVEQLAADRLNLGEDKRPLAAMGFLTLGRRFLNNQADIIDDRIDVVTRGLMGLTVGCARCHDHKFDPIPQKDYYSLYGVFASSTEPRELPLIGEVKRTPEVEAFEKELAKREAEFQAEVDKRFARYMKTLRSADGIADYLRAVIDSRAMATDRNGFIRERDLNRYVFERWREFLAPELKKDWSPVFGPLLLLAAIPEREFAEKAPAVVAALGNDPEKPANPLVRKALADAKPTTYKAAAFAVAGVLADTPPPGTVTPEQAEVFAWRAAGGPLDIPPADAAQVFNRLDRDQVNALKRKVDAFKANSPAAPPRAHVLADLPKLVEPVVFLRGNPQNRGPKVPRQFLEVAAGPARQPFADGSGRLELARAIASPDNPLTARVMVNRVWLGHFGQGLVRTPSDFGLRSDPPTHPELLDWLAKRFVEDGWSLKRLHKRIMLSATYRQSSQMRNAEFGVRNENHSGPAAVAGVPVLIPHSAFRIPQSDDPENKLLARQNRRRLDFEALRDGLLAAGGTLDRTAGGRSVDLFKAPFTGRRSVYGFVDRQNFSGTMRAFDVPGPDAHTPQRFQTTVPQQALFLMNSPFVTAQAKALASRPDVLVAATPEEKVRLLYRAALGRNPTTEEGAAAVDFVAAPRHWIPRAAEASQPYGAWPQLAQVLLLSNEFAFVD